jgi:hypothetical protein
MAKKKEEETIEHRENIGEEVDKTYNQLYEREEVVYHKIFENKRLYIIQVHQDMDGKFEGSYVCRTEDMFAVEIRQDEIKGHENRQKFFDEGNLFMAKAVDAGFDGKDITEDPETYRKMFPGDSK